MTLDLERPVKRRDSCEVLWLHKTQDGDGEPIIIYAFINVSGNERYLCTDLDGRWNNYIGSDSPADLINTPVVTYQSLALDYQGVVIRGARKGFKSTGTAGSHRDLGFSVYHDGTYSHFEATE